jgi:hypothetical protein
MYQNYLLKETTVALPCEPKIYGFHFVLMNQSSKASYYMATSNLTVKSYTYRNLYHSSVVYTLQLTKYVGFSASC